MIRTSSKAPRKAQILLQGAESCSRTAFREHDRDDLFGVLFGRLGALFKAAFLGPFFGLLSRVFGPFGRIFTPPESLLEASWGPLGGLLGSPGGLSGRRARFLSSSSLSWPPLGAFLGPASAFFSGSGVVLRPCWAILGLSPGLRGPSWGRFGSPLDGLGASERRKSEKAKNLEKTNENQRFWPLRALSGRLFGACRGVLAASWAVLGSSWTCSGDLGASRGELGASRGALGPSWSGPGQAWGVWGAPEPPGGRHGGLRQRPGPPPGPTPIYIYIYMYIYIYIYGNANLARLGRHAGGHAHTNTFVGAPTKEGIGRVVDDTLGGGSRARKQRPALHRPLHVSRFP